MKFTYTGVEVRDMDRAIAFYTKGMGMELLDRHEIPATKGEVAALRSKGSEQILELNWYPRRRYRSGSELDHLAFDVGDAGDGGPREIHRRVREGSGRRVARTLQSADVAGRPPSKRT